MGPRIHDRYLLKQFLRILFFSLLSFTLIYVTVDIFEEVDNFIDHEAKLQHVALYYLFSIPFILTYITPISLLLGTVFSMGIMGRRNELTALVASGVSLIRVSTPILIAALSVSVFSAYFNDVVVAKANRYKNDIMEHDIEGKVRSNPNLKENLHLLGADGFVYLASSYNHSSETLYDIVLQQFNENTLERRIDAKRASWNGEHWFFVNGFDRRFGDDEETVITFDTLVVRDITETPADFAKDDIDEENMNYEELKQYIDKVRRSGGNIERYLVDLHFKMSFPFAGSIFVLIGIALASGKRKQSMATGFGITLVVSFLYYGVLRVGQTLGHNGVMPPFIAAQLGNVVFLVIGLFLLIRANR